jgi:ABC-2 type transport system ATP-binding protein
LTRFEGDGALAEARDKLATAMEAFAAAQSTLPELRAALAAGRPLSHEQLAELSGARTALAQAARALDADPDRASLPELEARLASWEKAGVVRQALVRLAAASGPRVAAAELAGLSADAARLAAMDSWSTEDQIRASTLGLLVELADAGTGDGDDQRILALDVELRAALGPPAAAVVLAAARGHLVLPEGGPRAAALGAQPQRAEPSGKSPAAPPLPAPAAPSAQGVPGKTDRAIAGEPAISVRGLKKYFGDVHALDGVDIDVVRGSVFGLLGPNGAGKTTMVRILTTLLPPDEGTARVAGYDVVKDAATLRSVIGLTGQYAAVDEHLTGRENLELVGVLNHLGKQESRKRAGELLERFDLLDAADRQAKTYSGGMRRRLDLAASLVARPQVLFLDEPTTGLDPRGRMQLWSIIRELVREETTLLLTTQYLEEADVLSDRIAVMDGGRVIAEGTPDELKSRVGGEVIEVVVAEPDKVEVALRELAGLGAGPPNVDAITRRITIPAGDDGPSVLAKTVRRMDQGNVAFTDLALRRPTLDDVFLTLTGHAAEEAPETNGQAGRGRGRGRRRP